VGASREFSAGGVVVRQVEGRHQVAVIRPHGRHTTALPKGHIDPGESAEQAAVREVNEETGLVVSPGAKLGDVRYVYRFQQRTIFKVVSFFLFHWQAGEVGQITAAMRQEVDQAWWMPLSEAVTQLSYPGEREMAQKALEVLGGGEPSPPGPGYV
jgi:8-oxo-dGTP pyrophosphatase MutT (NUDIX family)